MDLMYILNVKKDCKCYTPTCCKDAEGDHDDHGDEDGDDHDGHDHGEEEHCEDFSSESDCASHAECEWHADEMTCGDADGDDDHGDEDGDDHDGHDHGDEHDEHGHNEDANSFELVGLAVGSGIFNVSIFHDGHADYTSMPIIVTVLEEEHCEDFSSESDCASHAECEWHADEMACEDAEGDHDHDHDHDHGDCDSEAHFNGDGIRLESNGVEVYRQFQGAITGDLSLHVNESMDLTVHFLDQNADDIEGES